MNMEFLHSLLCILNEMSPYVLLGFFIAGLMRAFVPQTFFSQHLGGNDFKTVLKSVLIGIPLPLCSCGVLPTAIGMRRKGASRASTTAFLIATPQTGVDSIAATWSLLGPAFAVIRPVVAIITSIVGGVVVGKNEEAGKDLDLGCGGQGKNEHSLRLEHDDNIPNVTGESELESHHQCCQGHAHYHETEHKNIKTKDKDMHTPFTDRCLMALHYGFIDLVGSIGNWLVGGLIIAALITVYVPTDFFASFSQYPIVSMLLVLLVAIPMYVCATGSIPIAMSLMLKGLSPGTALVLLMAGPAVNFASYALVSRELGKKTAMIYLFSIISGAIVFGLVVDYLLPYSWFSLSANEVIDHNHGLEFFPTFCSTILTLLLLITFIKNHIHHSIKNTEMVKEYVIKGMNCPHCQATVTKSILSVKGVKQVEVNLSTGIAKVDGDQQDEDVKSAVRAAGFDVE